MLQYKYLLTICLVIQWSMMSCSAYKLPKRTPAGRATYLHALQQLNKYKHDQNDTEFFQHSVVENYQKPKLQEIGKADTRDYKFRYEVTLDKDKGVSLLWDINPALEMITFRVQGRIDRADFMAVGFSPYGEVTDADFYVMWTNPQGKHYFQDMHMDAQGMLEADTSQDYELLDVHLRAHDVMITYQRKYDTCDHHDYLIDSGTTHILFMLESRIIHSPEGVAMTSQNTVLQRTQLLKSQIPEPPLPRDTQTFTMHVDKVHLPVQETTYWCQVTKLPRLDTKHHVIKYEGVISPEAEGVVHHMEVFHCDVRDDVELREYNAECRKFGAERPEGLEACRHVIGAWAMGAKAMWYPEEAGNAVGGPGFSHYVMMEVHYNNPQLRSGIVDSSGIKFWVTQELRRYDAGIMELGLEYTDKYAIPPGQELFDLNGYCIPQCTHVGLPERGVHVFASQLHTHLTGRRVFTKHYRRGAELPELNRDEHYSPHYQEIRALHRPVTVLPGDSLITTCQDSTIGKKNITMGGFAISDEMCVNYIHYYPKAALEVCKSSVTTKSLYGFFDFLKEYQGESTSRALGIKANYEAVRWTPMNTLLLSEFYDIAPLSMQCNRSDGARFPGVEWEGQRIPTILHPAPPTERPCLT